MRSWPPPAWPGPRGTLLHTRMLGGQEADRFLGIQLQKEKELVAILAKGEYKVPIMQTIADKAGLRPRQRPWSCPCLWIPWKACGKRMKRVCYKLCFLQQTPSKS